MVKHRKTSISKWQQIISAAENSSLSASEYCRENNLSSKSFYAWKTKLRRVDKPETNTGTRQVVKNWKSIVEDFNNSGLKVMEYCRKKNIPSSSLSTWRLRYRKHLESCRGDKFTEVKFKLAETDNVSVNSIADSGIHILFSNSVHVNLDSCFDESAFLKVIKLLKSELC